MVNQKIKEILGMVSRNYNLKQTKNGGLPLIRDLEAMKNSVFPFTSGLDDMRNVAFRDIKKELFFNITGKFQAKQRPRFNGKFAYTPKETRSYENLVRCKAEEEMVKNNLSIFTGPLIAEIEVLFDIPKSASKKMIENIKNNKEYPTKKPDVDNIAKTILDALNKVVYDDDSQVVDLIVHKVYGIGYTGVNVLIKEKI